MKAQSNKCEICSKAKGRRSTLRRWMLEIARISPVVSMPDARDHRKIRHSQRCDNDLLWVPRLLRSTSGTTALTCRSSDRKLVHASPDYLRFHLAKSAPLRLRSRSCSINLQKRTCCRDST
ncbi:hypothetical protein L484_007818 [Morus notabilis]|uniref:Uncharacterized protein n=1 Tax=Morus notabilis TaxID=981085 RepID=W9RWB6_9ROSA|nr:hypothetical protein L484_007818 [Morus notabilis]